MSVGGGPPLFPSSAVLVIGPPPHSSASSITTQMRGRDLFPLHPSSGGKVGLKGRVLTNLIKKIAGDKTISTSIQGIELSSEIKREFLRYFILKNTILGGISFGYAYRYGNGPVLAANSGTHYVSRRKKGHL